MDDASQPIVVLEPAILGHARDVLGLAESETLPNALPPRAEQLWRLDGFAANVPLVNTMFVPIGPVADMGLLHEAVAIVVQRHHALRTRLTIRHGRAKQIVEDWKATGIECTDIRKGDIEENRPGGRKSAVSEFTQAPIDLYAQDGFRCRAFRDENQTVTLGIVAHGFFSDAWSSQILRQEILAVHSALQLRESAALKPAAQYADYAQALRKSLDRNLASHLSYWHRKLRDIPPLQLPRDHDRQTGRRGRSFFLIEEDIVARLTALSQASRVSLTLVLLAAFQLSLARWSGQRDILSSAYTADRLDAKVQNTIGFLVASLPVCSRIDPTMGFSPFLLDLAKNFYGSYAHRELSCEVYEAIFSPPKPFCAPVFNFVPLQKNFSTSDMIAVPAFDGIISAPEVSRPAIFREIYLGLIQYPAGILGKLYFSADFFTPQGAAIFIQHFQAVILQIAADPNAKLKDLIGP
jgi:Condensation domain